MSVGGVTPHWREAMVTAWLGKTISPSLKRCGQRLVYTARKHVINQQHARWAMDDLFGQLSPFTDISEFFCAYAQAYQSQGPTSFWTFKFVVIGSESYLEHDIVRIPFALLWMIASTHHHSWVGFSTECRCHR